MNTSNRLLLSGYLGMIVTNTVKNIKITSCNEGQRLDNFLMSYLRNIPKNHIYKLIRSGQVRVNSSRAKASKKLYIDDLVRIPPYKSSERLKPIISDEVLKKTIKNILYEDNEIIVFNKPASLAVHSGTNIGYGLIDILRVVKINCERIDLLHRLDKDTSGCIIITKSFSALKFFQKQIKDNKIEKKYLCLVNGVWDKNIKYSEVDLIRNGKACNSISEFKILNYYKDVTLLEVNIITGRYHQIRKHCALLGHSILGDDQYGDRNANKIYKKNGLNRIFLHSFSISFFVEKINKKVTVKCSLPKDLNKYLELL